MKTFYYSQIAFAGFMLMQTSAAYAADEEDLAAVYGDKAIPFYTTQNPSRKA